MRGAILRVAVEVTLEKNSIHRENHDKGEGRVLFTCGW